MLITGHAHGDAKVTCGKITECVPSGTAEVDFDAGGSSVRVHDNWRRAWPGASFSGVSP